MDRDAEALRDDIERRRQEISGTVTEIENRIVPSHVLARRQDRVRRKLTDWKDSIFGNDQPDYPQRGYGSYGAHGATGNGGTSPGLIERGREQVGHAGQVASEAAGEVPSMLRRQTRGNPLAAGVIAVGAGWLVASVLPESRRERELARKIEPQLATAASTVTDEAKGAADELKGTVKDAGEQVKQAGQEAAHDVADTGREAAQKVAHREA